MKLMEKSEGGGSAISHQIAVARRCRRPFPASSFLDPNCPHFLEKPCRWGQYAACRAVYFGLLFGHLLISDPLSVATDGGLEFGAGSVEDGHLSELQGVPHIIHQGRNGTVFHVLLMHRGLSRVTW